MENNLEIIEELNDILQKNYDAVNGFQTAAEKVNDIKLMGYFNEQVIARKRFIMELSNEIKLLGGEPTESGSVAGTMHRAWMNIKQGFNYNDDNREELIEECIRGEKQCIDEYNDLLEEKTMGASTRQLLNRQKAEVVSTLAELEIKEEIHDD